MSSLYSNFLFTFFFSSFSLLPKHSLEIEKFPLRSKFIVSHNQLLLRFDKLPTLSLPSTPSHSYSEFNGLRDLTNSSSQKTNNFDLIYLNLLLPRLAFHFPMLLGEQYQNYESEKSDKNETFASVLDSYQHDVKLSSWVWTRHVQHFIINQHLNYAFYFQWNLSLNDYQMNVNFSCAIDIFFLRCDKEFLCPQSSDFVGTLMKIVGYKLEATSHIILFLWVIIFFFSRTKI